MVSNLLVNAIKFTPERGHVKIALALIDGRVHLTVTDTGIGIEPAFLPHVFTRFAQADSSTTRTYAGLGLGLAIVRYIVEAHGGVVHASSGGKGTGATFTVELPLLGADRPAFAVESGRARAATRPGDRGHGAEPSLRDLRVLVIDDDSGTGHAVADLLRQRGAEISLAGSAGQARVLVREFRPDVLVCDIAMPSEDGYSFIRRLRHLGESCGGRTPALALTAMATDTDRRRALAAGFQMHVTKPFDIEELTRAVATLAARSGISPD